MVQREIVKFEHPDKEPVNNPPTSLVTPETNGASGSTGVRKVPRATFDPRSLRFRRFVGQRGPSVCAPPSGFGETLPVDGREYRPRTDRLDE